MKKHLNVKSHWDVLLWDYLSKKCNRLNDNNKVARDIFNYVSTGYKKK